jgi:hypothetical protein
LASMPNYGYWIARKNVALLGSDVLCTFSGEWINTWINDVIQFTFCFVRVWNSVSCRTGKLFGYSKRDFGNILASKIFARKTED